MKKFAFIVALGLLAVGLGMLTACSDERQPKVVSALSDEDFFRLCRRGTPEQVERALKEGANVNAKFYDDKTALLEVITFRINLETVKVLLAAGADVNIKDKEGHDVMWHVLHPIQTGDMSVGRAAEDRLLLLALGPALQAGLTEEDKSRFTWRYVLETPDVARQALENGADVNAADNEGATALMYAARLNTDPEVARVLLAAGANVDAKDQYGTTALMRAAKFNGNPEVVKALLAAGADVNARDDLGMTALEIAAIFNSTPGLVEVFLAGGADANTRSREGVPALLSRESDTALMLAAWGKNHEAAAALLAGGADINAKNKYGWTALMWAVVSDRTPEFIKTLLAAGADINAKDNNGETALAKAVKDNHPEVAAVLLAAGADASVKDGKDMTPLIWAAAYNRSPEMFKVLLAGGADVNGKDSGDRTALMWAVRFGNRPAVEALLAAGADVHAVCEDGRDALWRAQRSADRKADGKAILRLLEKAVKR